MNFEIDAFSYRNRFRRIPAWYKMILTFLLGIITYASHLQVQMAVFLSLFIFNIWIVKLPAKVLLKWLLLPTAFLLLSLPPILIGIGRTHAPSNDVLISIFSIGNWWFYISKAGIALAYPIIFRAISLFLCIFTLFITTPFNEILLGLAKLRVPQVLLDLLLSMYRFIFIFMGHANELNIVIKSRQGNNTWRRSLHSFGLLIVQLFTRTFESYRRMSLVIESRGFTDQLFYIDEKNERVPRNYIKYGFLSIVFLLGIEWWCRYS